MGRKKTTFQCQQGDDDNEGFESSRRNKSQLKREESARQDVVKQLVSMPQAQRAALAITDELKAALQTAVQLRAKRKGKSAYRRQLLVIASLLRDASNQDVVDAFLSAKENGNGRSSK